MNDDQWWDSLTDERKTQIRKWLTNAASIPMAPLPGQEKLDLEVKSSKGAPPRKVVFYTPRGGVV